MKIIMATYFRNIKLNVGLILIVTIILFAKFTKSDTVLNYNVSSGIDFIPLHYNVKIRFDAYTNIFYGKCNVSIRINRPTKNITIRRAEILGIVKIDLIKHSDIANNQTIFEKHPLTVYIEKLAFSNEINIYLNFTSSLVDFLDPGLYTLQMIYVPSILDDEDPFESYYTDKEKVFDDKSIKMLNVKALFPCWDVPLFKSTFYISVYHHKNYTFLSNIGVQKSWYKNENNMLWTSFNESSLISAQYLTIVIISNTSTINIISSNASIEFWCRKEIINYMLFAGNITKEIVYFLNQKSTKKVPKINYIATRNYQHNNIKLKEYILLREKDIIYNEALDHIAHKIKIANLIAQQTISYWYDDMLLWSKKEFIAFLAAHILDKTKLIYRMMDLFTVQTQQESSRFNIFPDILSLHTANISIVHSSRSFYDYIKSSIIWRMLYHMISEDVFWNSINTYMNRQYNQSNTLQINELWDIIQFNSNENLNEINIEDIINTWITQNRYPELHVNRSYLNNKTEFFLNIDLTFNKDAKYSTLVTFKTKSQYGGSFMLYQPNFNFSLYYLFDKYDDWILVNLQQAEYYRVKYNIENWENLAHYLYYENHTDIHVLNRAQIIEDVFYYFMKKDTISYHKFWNITRFLFNDTNYIAWYPMIKAVEYITCIWPVQYTHNLKHQIYKMFNKLLQNIGYHDISDFMYESDFTKYLREEAIRWACILGEHQREHCRLTALIELQKDLQNSIQSKNWKGKEWMYCKGLKEANNTIWHKVYEKWQKTKDNILLEYLTCSPDFDINKDYFQRVIEYKFIEKVSNNNTYINIVLLIIAKHAKTASILKIILKEIEFIRLSSNKQVDQIAILIVIITHNISVKNFQKIRKWATDHWSDEQLIDAIKKKIKNRKKEYQRQVNNYGF